jgi:hypothetical protein
MTDAPASETLIGDARKRASEELGLPVEHPLVKRMAKFMALDDQVQADIEAGIRVDIGSTIRIDAVLQEIRDRARDQKPLVVQIEII